MTIGDAYEPHLAAALVTAEEIVNGDDPQAALEQYIRKHEGLRHQLKTLENGKEVLLGGTVADGAKIIVANFGKNKYLYSILITCLVEKLVHPQQDIRIAQSNLAHGYSNRSTDAARVTPFLSDYGLTHCATSGAESGRNFERPAPFDLAYSGKANGKGNRESFLGMVHAVQVEGIAPAPCIALLMALDKLGKKKATYQYPKAQGLTIDEIHEAVIEHYDTAEGNGRARLPVLAIQAIYKCLVGELSRYRGTVLRDPPNRHTSNDKKGWVGDIQIDRADGTPFEAVEVKADKQIAPGMVNALPSKFAGEAVDRYYILSASDPYIAPKQNDAVHAAASKVRGETGCQIIVNGLVRSLWYYLRMLSDTDQFIEVYTQQIQTDEDVKDEHRALWAAILVEIAERSAKASSI